MLTNRIISMEKDNTMIRTKMNRDCPQSRVLPPSLWLIVVDRLIMLLKKRGLQVIGYADDLFVRVRAHV